MATRKKTKAKAKSKRNKPMRKKTPISKVSARKKPKTARKKTARNKTAGKRPVEKAPVRRASPRKTRPSAGATVKPAPARPPQPAAVRASPSMAAQPSPSEERIGIVTHYFSHLSVATLLLDPGAILRVGDMIHIRGHTTDFSQKIESLEVDHAPATEVGPNDDFGLKVVEHAREHDVVYKVRP